MNKITAKFRAFLKAIDMPETEIMAPLAGINELRKVVQWANGQPEYTHDYMTPAEIMARYRKENS